MSKKLSKKSLKKRCDTLFSKITRSKGFCERCGKTDAQLQAAHICSRRFLSTRWSKDNIVCLCASCHRWGHNFPTLFTSFVKKIKGSETIAYITHRALNEIRKMTLKDYEELHNELKKEYEQIQ